MRHERRRALQSDLHLTRVQIRVGVEDERGGAGNDGGGLAGAAQLEVADPATLLGCSIHSFDAGAASETILLPGATRSGFTKPSP